MWQSVIDKMKSQNETERLEQVEKYIRSLKETVVGLEKRSEKLEKKNDK